MESLQEIKLERFPEFMAYCKTDWPRGAVAYYYLEKYLEYETRQVPRATTFYCPYGNMNNGIIAITNHNKVGVDIFIACFQETPRALEKCLLDSKVIVWEKNIHFSYIATNVMPCLQRAMASHTLAVGDLVESFALILRKENHLYPFTIPPEVYIEKMKVEEAEEIDSLWTHRTLISAELFRNRILHDRAFGVYTRADNKIVAWVLMNELGYATHWYTKEEYRGKGYGELIMKYFSNTYLSQGKDLTAQTVFGNWSSLKMLLKLNWDVFGVFRWFDLKKLAN